MRKRSTSVLHNTNFGIWRWIFQWFPFLCNFLHSLYLIFQHCIFRQLLCNQPNLWKRVYLMCIFIIPQFYHALHDLWGIFISFHILWVVMAWRSDRRVHCMLKPLKSGIAEFDRNRRFCRKVTLDYKRKLDVEQNFIRKVHAYGKYKLLDFI